MSLVLGDFVEHGDLAYRVPPIGQAVASCPPLIDGDDLSEFCDVADCCFCLVELWVTPELLTRFLTAHPSIHLACHYCYRKMFAVFN